MKHTPGPWHIGMNPGPFIYGPNGEQVADLRADLLDDGEREANARLLAAVPKLLAALETVTEIVSSNYEALGYATQPEAVRQARAAIAEAIGDQPEPHSSEQGG